jgi:hypothetical protein
MLAVTVITLLALAAGSLSPDLDPDRPEMVLEPPADRKDPCGGRNGWVGDGEDGRDPPACEGPDSDGDLDAAGLRAPDWLRGGEDEADGGPQLR